MTAGAWLELIASGLITGGVYALVALGLAHSTRKKPAPNPIAHVVAALVLVNIAIAYLW